MKDISEPSANTGNTGVPCYTTGVASEEHEALALQGEAAARRKERDNLQLRLLALQRELQQQEEECKQRETGANE